LNRVLFDGVFFAAHQLYGVTFKERHDLPVYQPDVRVFEVYDRDGSPLALLLEDFYARPNKKGGAWMNQYVGQARLLGTQPVVANHHNIPKPVPGQPTLLTFDEVVTLFHEFGHGLHGIFSSVNYPMFSGTSVPRDFVEYPSQVNEMWAAWPEVVRNYARNYKTGEPMPEALLNKVIETRKFNQGFATTEYLKATLLDWALHTLRPDQTPTDLPAFEDQTFRRYAVDFALVPPRYRSTYFSHIFVNNYAANYYSYIWADVMVADSIEWFTRNGGMTRANGDRFRRMVLSRGGSAEALTLFRDFGGTDPDVRPLIRKRGLDEPGN
jgi:peptidyl-dipeptidase Dcp